MMSERGRGANHPPTACIQNLCAGAHASFAGGIRWHPSGLGLFGSPIAPRPSRPTPGTTLRIGKKSINSNPHTASVLPCGELVFCERQCFVVRHPNLPCHFPRESGHQDRCWQVDPRPGFLVPKPIVGARSLTVRGCQSRCKNAEIKGHHRGETDSSRSP